MKCPECSTNHKYSGGMTCSCGYVFALDPKRDGYADGKLLAADRKASSDQTHYYTTNQLATTVEGMKPGKTPTVIISLVFIFVGIGIYLLADEWLPMVCFGCVGLAILLTSLLGYDRAKMDQLTRAVQKYESAKQPLPFLLHDDRPLKDPPPDWPEQDLYDYGAEGILILQRPLLVDLFVLNGFHAANRVLVVSADGYPDHLIPHVNRILEEQPDVPVYVLHDSSDEGAALVARVHELPFLKLHGQTVTDLGLSRSDLTRMPKLKRFAVRDEVAVDHLKWDRLSTGAVAGIAGGVALVDVIGRDPEASAWAMSYG